jgi:hypothetical protein
VLQAGRKLVVNVEGQGQFVRGFVPVFFRFEMEKTGIVPSVGFLESLAEPRVNAVAVGEGAEASVILDAAAFADAKEDHAVDDALDGEVEFALRSRTCGGGCTIWKGSVFWKGEKYKVFGDGGVSSGQ